MLAENVSVSLSCCQMQRTLTAKRSRSAWTCSTEPACAALCRGVMPQESARIKQITNFKSHTVGCGVWGGRGAESWGRVMRGVCVCAHDDVYGAVCVEGGEGKTRGHPGHRPQTTALHEPVGGVRFVHVQDYSKDNCPSTRIQHGKDHNK